ncbi:MAG: polyketide cyclase / dehydrase and lipid transport [Propionibacteriales bacterium]|nr:polyketide cyclase / dehydrase and lipid transport [Propionibacteriales bacterium]
MPWLDLIDESFVVAARRDAREMLCDEGCWRTWFPGLRLQAYDDRGLDGVRWRVTGDLAGTAEVWLEEFGDGVLVHVFIRADRTAEGSDSEPAPVTRPRRERDRLRRRYAVPLKHHLLAAKDALEGDRRPGHPRVARPIESSVRGTTTDDRGERADG